MVLACESVLHLLVGVAPFELYYEETIEEVCFEWCLRAQPLSPIVRTIVAFLDQLEVKVDYFVVEPFTRVGAGREREGQFDVVWRTQYQAWELRRARTRERTEVY
jgi:hypothetical protein